MNRISEYLDALVCRLKQHAPLCGVRFIRAYGNEQAEHPIRGFLAVVGVTSARQSQAFVGERLTPTVNGERCRAEAEIRVYAPVGGNGAGLSACVFALMNALREEDEEGLLSDIAAGSIEFDHNGSVVFRRLSFSVDFCVCGEGEHE